MNFISNIALTISALKINKKRAFLTMLGVIIGVGSVIVIMSVGAGAQSLLINELSGFGSNLFGVTPGAASENGPPASVMGISVTTLKLKDVEDIKKIPYVISAVGYVRGVDTITYDDKMFEATFVGTHDDMPGKVEMAGILNGRFFVNSEVKSMSKVVVLGYDVAKYLFAEDNPVGKKIKIKKHNFKIIGVMEKRGTVAFENKDSLVYIPITTAQKLMLGINHVSLIRGKINNADNMDIVINEAREVIRRNHNIENPKHDDFSVRSLDQALDALTTVTDSLRFFLAGIAAISLVVGGIGIMNIMLVNVAERTKEIGLRKAIGAKNIDILGQFLIESVTLTIIGGIIGMIFGIILSWVIAFVAQKMGYKWDFVVTIFSVLLGLFVSAFVGIVFGLYPSNKAAKMQPIEALRRE